MANRVERGRGSLGYFVRFGLTAAILVAGTLVLVLVVFPQRYVLSAGFREAGLNFPSPTVPFVPQDPARYAARPDRGPFEAVPIEPGPAEAFWSNVLPLLEDGAFGDAVVLFDDYLAEYPSDADVRRELAATLLAAGRLDDALPVLRLALEEQDDPAVRRALARALRDSERIDEASAEYDLLHRANPQDVDLTLEWAQAYAWHERYADAERVLVGALAHSPGSVRLRVELARIYYFSDRLVEAEPLLGDLTDEELATADGRRLRDAVREALAVPEVTPDPPPTTLERALQAREADDFDLARRLFEAALTEDPTAALAWLEYADFLEYELGDFDGAREALAEVEGLGGADARLQMRIALLDAWAGRTPAALARLEALLTTLATGPAAAHPTGDRVPPSPAAVRAVIGDLHRWDGDRLAAARAYERSLDDEPDNRRALDGLVALRSETSIVVHETESPRVGTLAYGLGDTDDFGRLDLGGEWIAVRDDWVWSAAVGQRWLSGRSVAPAPATHSGPFAEVAPARWWRWGTVRTAARLGIQSVASQDADLTFGASVTYRSPVGNTLGVEYAHEPAYGLSATLQSAAARLTQDRILASASRAVGDRWRLALVTDLARLDSRGVAGAEPSTRLQASVSVLRALNETWSVGWNGVAARYSEAAPVVNGLRLFWDPETALSTGPVATARGALSSRWAASLRINPGVALIDERAVGGLDAVPRISAEAGLEYTGPRLRSSVDVFYGQARLEGYRTYGVRVSLSAESRLIRDPGR